MCAVAISEAFSGCPQACRNEHVTTVKRGTAKGDTSSCLLASDFDHEASRENLQYTCMVQCFKDFLSILFCAKIFLESPLCYAYTLACTCQCACSVCDELHGWGDAGL